jgi:FMN-dependent NADH-azoreductase
MPTLLQLDSSADLRTSRSRAVTAAFADAWRALGDDHTVVVRDLHTHPLPHLEDAALHWPAALRPAGAVVTPEAEALQQEILAELLAADALVIGVPLYNYSMPSTLKAWVDRIHVPGVTAPSDDPIQPLAGRPAVLVTARGASYDEGSPTEGWDHAIPPLQLILGSALGMDVRVITTSLTLAESMPVLAEQRPRAQAEYEAALADATALARELGA